MTPFEFMVNAFCIAAGMIFLSVGGMIVLAVICGIYNGIREMVLDDATKDVSEDEEKT